MCCSSVLNRMDVVLGNALFALRATCMQKIDIYSGPLLRTGHAVCMYAGRGPRRAGPFGTCKLAACTP